MQITKVGAYSTQPFQFSKAAKVAQVANNNIGVELNISEQSIKMLAQFRQEQAESKQNFVCAEVIRDEEFTEMGVSSIRLSPHFRELEGLTHADVNCADSMKQHFGFNDTSLELYYQLIPELSDAVSLNEYFCPVRLANRYAEIRQELEVMYYGAELQDMLEHLSVAFDAHANSIASFESGRVSLAFAFSRIISDMLYYAKPKERKALDGLLSKLTQKVVDGMKESAKYFAQLTKQFVIQHGLVNSESSKRLLDNFLMSAPTPKDAFTFDEFSNMKETFKTAYHNKNLLLDLKSILGFLD
jgi:hypothetical protein